MKQNKFWFFDKKEMSLLILIFAGLCLSFAWSHVSKHPSKIDYSVVGDTMSPTFASKQSKKMNERSLHNDVKYKLTNKQQLPKIELNSADSAQLESLPMIGAKLAQRIVRYREKLGGFYTMEQLKEVYGLRDSCYNVVKSRVWVDSLKLNSLSLNHASMEQLGRHPYIGFKNAKIICRYRQEHGEIKDCKELMQIKGLLVKKSKMWTIYLAYP